MVVDFQACLKKEQQETYDSQRRLTECKARLSQIMKVKVELNQHLSNLPRAEVSGESQIDSLLTDADLEDLSGPS